MKKATSLFAPLAAVILAVLLLASCGKQGDDAAQTTVASTPTALTQQKLSQLAPGLFKGAQDFYGFLALGTAKTVEFDYSSLPAQDNDCKYAEVDEEFKTVAQLKSAAEKYYTARYLEENLYSCFDGPYEIYREIDGKLCLNIDAGGGGSYTYLADTAKLVSSAAQTAEVTVDCVDNYGGQYTADVTLKAVNGNWSIDSLTYADK